jgi:hypothetical protein
MANNPLSTESILKHMADALPTHTKGDTTSDFSSSYEAIALFAHACMTAVGFRLIGYGEHQKIGNISPSYLVLSLTAFRSRARRNSSTANIKMELFVWITFLSLRTFTIVNAICY